ncbi:MAG: putative Fe-Mo cluster-binding NifX family protein [Desulforhopalus sp.]
MISFNISVDNLPDLSSVVYLDPPTEERSLRLFFALFSNLVENKKSIVYIHSSSVTYKGINIMRIAIPSNKPGGLEASRSDHFGHCDLFTIVDLDENKEVKEVSVIANGDHKAGGCMAPVELLHKAGITVIIVGGMGKRPMQGFAGVGIDVYFADKNSVKVVGEAVEKFTNGKLPVMHTDQVCTGSGNCHH